MSTLAFSSFPESDGKLLRSVVRISGDDSERFDGVEYVIGTDDAGESTAFEIRYEYHCSPFRECLRIGDVLAVGHEAHFYLFDTAAKKSLLVLHIDGYFGHLYLDQGRLYVAGCCDLYCIEPSGQIIWTAEGLGIDGVVIEEFGEERINGVGEWDPPGGWRPFVLDRFTGRKIAA